jgi:Na+-transporting methylmalonyl-CoA/oxaloacetate decarboxylase gamma subunit
MGEDIGTGAKIAITMIILLAVVFSVISVYTMTMYSMSKVATSITDSMQPQYEKDIQTMATLAEPLPVPTIYYALSRYGFANLAQFDLSVSGVTYTDPEELTNNFAKQFYVKLVVAPDGYHVWVGDYY